LDVVEQAVIATDLEGTILYWNHFAEELYGWQAAEVTGKNIVEVIAVEPLHPEVAEGMARLSRGESWAGEFLVRRRDGSSFPVTVTSSPIFDEKGQLIGRIGLSLDISERKRVEAEQARLFDELNQQREQLRALTGQLAEAQEMERKELARELHDQIGQSLTALNLNLNFIRTRLAETGLDAGSVQARLVDSTGLVAEMAERVRNLLAELRPPMFDDYGLVAAIRWYGSRLAGGAGFTFTIHGKEPVPRLAAPLENALFRITQEALTNVAKHAQATQVTVTLEAGSQAVRLVIFDDGVGFEPAGPAEFIGRQSWGLLTMSERAEAVGGRCAIKSRSGVGTQIIVEVGR
jgi:PAS domain S-box-containing protein